MLLTCNQEKISNNEIIFREQRMIKKRIKFLQQCLIQISFASVHNRPELYKKLLEKLHSAQLLLIKNQEIQQKYF